MYLASILVYSLEHRNDIFWWYIGHDVVDSIEHKATAGRKDFDIVANVDLHFFWGSMVDDPARVGATTPEGYVIAKLLFEALGIHVSGTDLHRIDDLESGVNQVGHQFVDRAT